MTTQHIHRIEDARSSRIQVIAPMAFAVLVGQDYALNAGANEYLSTSLTLERLVKIIKNLSWKPL